MRYVFFTYIITPLLFTEARYYYLKYKDSRCIKKVAFSLATKSVSFHT